MEDTESGSTVNVDTLVVNGVELRRHSDDNGRRRRNSGGTTSTVSTTSSGSRRGALRRRPGASISLQKFDEVRKQATSSRYAIYVDYDDEDDIFYRTDSDSGLIQKASIKHNKGSTRSGGGSRTLPAGVLSRPADGGGNGGEEDDWYDDDSFDSDDDDQIYENPTQIVSEIQQQEKVRHHIVEELINTERKYIEKLGFLKKMKGQLSSINSVKFIMPPEEIDKMFPVIDQLFELHNGSLMPAFRLALSNWNDQSSIGYVFLIHAAKINIYKTYIMSSPRAIQTIDTWSRTEPKFANLIKLFQQNSATENISIQDIMQEPYIKLQRWKLLLQRYHKYVPSSNQDCIDIPSILSKFENILNECEETLKQAENLDALLELEKKIEGVMVFLSSDTQFIKDGPVTEIDPRSKRQCLMPVKRQDTPLHMFLFNDVILFCSPKQKNKKYLVCCKIPLSAANLMSANCLASMGYNTNRCFILRSTKKAIPLLFASAEEKQDWGELISRAIYNLQQRSSIKKKMQDTSCSDFTCAPVWLPDDSADSCTICCRVFNLILRRHHCRGCGIF